jgi:hypothetical protein
MTPPTVVERLLPPTVKAFDPRRNEPALDRPDGHAAQGKAGNIEGSARIAGGARRHPRTRPSRSTIDPSTAPLGRTILRAQKSRLAVAKSTKAKISVDAVLPFQCGNRNFYLDNVLVSCHIPVSLLERPKPELGRGGAG